MTRCYFGGPLVLAGSVVDLNYSHIPALYLIRPAGGVKVHFAFGTDSFEEVENQDSKRLMTRKRKKKRKKEKIQPPMQLMEREGGTKPGSPI